MRSTAALSRPRTAAWWRLGAATMIGVLAVGHAGAADVGVSVSISQPGVYGRVDIGRFPQPAVVVAQPRVVVHAPHRAAVPPVYLWVPPGHRQHWAHHCRAYGACGAPVYFVRDDWYGRHVMAGRHGWAPPHQRHDGQGGHRNGWHGERDRGHGPGRGHGHGHGGPHGGGHGGPRG